MKSKEKYWSSFIHEKLRSESHSNASSFNHVCKSSTYFAVDIYEYIHILNTYI